MGKPRLDNAVGRETAGRPGWGEKRVRKEIKGVTEDRETLPKYNRSSQVNVDHDHDLLLLKNGKTFELWVDVFLYLYPCNISWFLNPECFFSMHEQFNQIITFSTYLPCWQAGWRHPPVHCVFGCLLVWSQSTRLHQSAWWVSTAHLHLSWTLAWSHLQSAGGLSEP